MFFITVALESVSADFFLFGEKVGDMVLLAEVYSVVQVSSPILLWTQFKLYGEFENTLYVSTLLHMLMYVVCKKYIVSVGLLIKIHDALLICLLVTLFVKETARFLLYLTLSLVKYVSCQYCILLLNETLSNVLYHRRSHTFDL